MKKYLIFICSVLLGFAVKSQDLIILKNGEEIQSIVKEVGVDLIKYQKFDNPSGPLYNIEKSKVFMIKYQNGSKDIFNAPAPPNPTPELPKKDTIVPKVPIKEVKPSYLEYKLLGVKRNGQIIHEDTALKLLAPYPEALQVYNAGSGLHAGATVFSYLEIGTLLTFGILANRQPTEALKKLMTRRGLIITGSMMVVGVTLNISGIKKKKQAMHLYNAAIDKKFGY